MARFNILTLSELLAGHRDLQLPHCQAVTGYNVFALAIVLSPGLP
jgi:hypothetical protein